MKYQLFAHGVDFDLDVYLASTSLRFDGIWRKGEYGRNHPKSNGVYKTLWDGRDVPIFEQERIAIEYLSENRVALKDLAQYPQVTTFILGLHYLIKSDDNSVGFCLSPSALLMWNCLDIGISLTYYVAQEREPGQDL
jgi:hypothetical protein